MSELKSILVAVDFGSTSQRAYEAAIDLASRLRAPLEIVHVCAPVPTTVTDESAYTAPVRERLAGLVDNATSRGVTARAHLKLETPVFGLLEIIDQLEPMLVVVGSHGRRGIQRALLGSVSDALAHRSAVPVVIVPAPERKQAAERAAWSCASCGHILGKNESSEYCNRCSATPVQWIGAPITSGPIDLAEAAIGEATVPDLSASQTRDPASTFAISPPGVEGYDVNPELRVRY